MKTCPLYVCVAATAASLLLSGCRGDVSTEPPIHLIRHMQSVPRYDPQKANELFADGRAMRPLVEGTVARGQLRTDEHLYEGRVHGIDATTLPMPVTPELLTHGRERFNIFCAPCHDAAGKGNGLVSQHGFLPPPADLHQERLRGEPVGDFFRTISNGLRTMPPYAAQIPVADRWAIAAYIRALQLTDYAPLDAVPESVRASNGWKP